MHPSLPPTACSSAERNNGFYKRFDKPSHQRDWVRHGPHEDPRAHALSANALRWWEARRNEEELPKEHLEAPFLGDAAQRVALPGRHGCPLAPKTQNFGAGDLRAEYIACVTC